MSSFSRARSKTFRLPDNSVDVIISNCVINLSADKDQRARAKRFACSSRAADSRFPTWSSAARYPPKSGAAWNCGSVALRVRCEEYDYVAQTGARPGFDAIDIEPTRVYSIEDARQFLSGEGIDVDAIAPQVEGKFMSAFIRAEKPSSDSDSREACCGPTCCS